MFIVVDVLSKLFVDNSLTESSCCEEDALISEVDIQDDESDVWITSSIFVLVELAVLEGKSESLVDKIVVDVSECLTVGDGFVVVGGLVISGGHGRIFVVFVFVDARVVRIDVISFDVEKVSIVDSAVERRDGDVSNRSVDDEES